MVSKKSKEITRTSMLWVWVLGIFSLLLISIKAQENKTFQIVQCIGEICVGPNASVDRDVKEQYGEGLFNPDEPHMGGRYYIHPQKLFTIHIVVGVDEMIEAVELTKGIDLPSQFQKDWRKAVTTKLKKTPVVDFGLRLGMSPDELIKKLGKSTNDKKEGKKRIVSYESTIETDLRVGLAYASKCTFISDHLVKITLFDGE